MASSLIKLGLVSLISSVALAAPFPPAAPGLAIRDYSGGDARPSYNAGGRGGRGRGKGKGRASQTSRYTLPTNAANYAAPQAQEDVTVYETKTNLIYVTATPGAAAPAAEADAGAQDPYAAQKQRVKPQPANTPAAQPAAQPAYTAPAAAAPAASAPAASTPASSSGSGAGSYSGAKGGVAYESVNQVSPFIGKPNIGWCYNWNANPGNLGSGIEYIPTLWGLDNAHLGSWVDAGNAAIGKGATAVVGFNEPDHKEQANLDVNTAASAYKQYITNNFSGKAKLVSPSVTNGPAPMGLSYLSNFMSACSDCGIQAINIHWYDSSSNVEYFKSHIQGAYDQFKLPIWLTEFGTTDGNDQAFLAEVLPWLDSQPFVERYAYFMAKEGVLLSGGQLSAAGSTYASA